VSRVDLDAATGIRSLPDQSGAALSPPREPQPRDPGRRATAGEAATRPPVGQPGHGRTASLRRQPTPIVDGRTEGGCTGAFEIICRDCGDHPQLEYPEILPRLQQLRGPYTLDAGIAAYGEHLGLAAT
jgi:hypothetical protein